MDEQTTERRERVAWAIAREVRWKSWDDLPPGAQRLFLRQADAAIAAYESVRVAERDAERETVRALELQEEQYHRAERAEARCFQAEAERDALVTALREIHDRSLLPFDDNDRRWISEHARAALASVAAPQEAEGAGHLHCKEVEEVCSLDFRMGHHVLCCDCGQRMDQPEGGT